VKSYRIENRSRAKFRFQAIAKDGARDADHDLVLGDAQDTDEVLAEKGIERNARCPSPVVTVTEAQLAKLSPVARREYDALRAGTRPKTGPYASGPWPVLVVTESGA
jgi:hypothetical protein